MEARRPVPLGRPATLTILRVATSEFSITLQMQQLQRVGVSVGSEIAKALAEHSAAVALAATAVGALDTFIEYTATLSAIIIAWSAACVS